MAQLFDIKKVVVGPRLLTATVVVAPSAPLRTAENLEATTLVWKLMPQLRDHVCLGDSAPSFGDVMGDTEIAHLLEHVTVELLARTNIAGDITSGQTAEVGERTYEIAFTCTDDVLVCGALSSAAWIMQWAFAGGGEPEPDVDAIAAGLVELVGSLPVVEEPEAEAAVAPEVGAEEPAVDGEQVAEAGVPADQAVVDGAEGEMPVEPQEYAEEGVAAEAPVYDAPVEGVVADEPQVDGFVSPEAAAEPLPFDEEAATPAPVYEFDPQQVEAPVAPVAPVAEEPAAQPAPVYSPDPVYVSPADYAPDPTPDYVVPQVDQQAQSSKFGDWGMENIPRPRPVR